MNEDKTLLQHAVQVAEKGIETGHGPFGAVIAIDGKIIAEASNMVVLTNDPTAHAEVIAIRKAAAMLETFDLSQCTLYTSCEPCPMCLGAIYWAGIRKVVYSSDRIDAEKSDFSDRMIYEEITLDPADRKVKFIRIPDAGGERVFKKWNDFENKIPY